MAAINYTEGWKTYSDMKNARYGIYNSVADKPEYLYSYNDDRYDRNWRLGGMLNYTFSPSNGNKFEFKNIFNQLASDRYTKRTGYQFISGHNDQEKYENNYSRRTT